MKSWRSTCRCRAARWSSSARGAGAFTIVTFRLTERRGGDCGRGTGETTGGAIRVANGKIREWYRLYEADDRRPPNARIDPGPNEA